MEAVPTTEKEENTVSVKSTEEPTKSKWQSFVNELKEIKETMSDQDFKQKTGSYVAFTLELYRVFMGTLLLFFVPQKCGDELCSFSQMTTKTDAMHVGNISVNLATFVAFFMMYVIELRRENKMISYLEVNKEFPCDNDAVGEALLLLPEKKRKVILNLDGSYQMACYIAAFFYLGNSVYSGFTIYDNYYDSKTTTVFVTNLLFLVGKIVDVYGLANTETNIFYSAYLKDKVQYNYADPDKVKEEHRVTEMVDVYPESNEPKETA
ncbi:hypothetical protein OAS95_04725 [Pelagibacteraceae bacterium]|nr:hypothetical protein [Pelagibacteraceae bacterium]